MQVGWEKNNNIVGLFHINFLLPTKINIHGTLTFEATSPCSLLVAQQAHNPNPHFTN